MKDLSQKFGSSIAAKAIPWILLGLGIAATVSVWFEETQNRQLYLQSRFDSEVERGIQAITERMKAYEEVLYATTGLFRASKSVERDEFQEFYVGLNLEKNLPGIQALGYSEFIGSKERVAAFEEGVRTDGYADFSVTPATERSEYHSIKYIEPFTDRNKRAFGFDMHSEATRRAAMDKARSTGNAALSGKVTLLQEGNGQQQAGTLLYVPIYKNGMPTDTEPERQQAFLGFAYAPFRMNDLMDGILNQDTLRQVDFAIYDGARAGSGFLLYTNDDEEAEYEPYFQDHRTIEIAGRTWLINFHSSEFFEHNYSRFTPYGFLATGLVVSILLFFLARFIYAERERALRLATSMTAKFQESEAGIRMLTNNIPSGILFENAERRIVYANGNFLTLFGIAGKAQDLIGTETAAEIARTKKLFKDPDGFQKRIDEIVANKEPVHGEQLQLSDGRVYERDCIPIFVGAEFKGFLRQYRDVTKQKQYERDLAEKNEELKRTNALMVGRELKMQELKGEIKSLRESSPKNFPGS